MGIIKKHWPLFAALALLCLAVFTTLMTSLRQNQGHLIYALDDVYLHAAMAKNIVQYGVWGMSRYGFTSATSSPLYTLLVALSFFLFGMKEAIPIIINIVLGILMVIWFHFVLRKETAHSLLIFLILLAVIFLTPLPTLSGFFSGMEHVLFAFLAVAFVYLSAGVLARKEATTGESALLFVLSPLMAGTRYEGLFIIFVVSCLFLLRRMPRHALLIGGLGVLPAIVYGLYAVSQGWYFLPNSVLLKGNPPDFSSLKSIILFALKGYRQLARNPHILLLMLGAMTILYFKVSREKRVWTDSTIMLIIFLAIAALHLQFAKADWSMLSDARYDGYLMCVGFLALSVSLLKYVPEKFALNRRALPQYFASALFILLLLSPFVLRGALSLATTPRATTNIYEQQYQMGLFLREFYQGQSVAANDIGAINYLADIHCLDLWGLASMEVAVAKRNQQYDTRRIYELAKAKNVKIAIVYDQWYTTSGGLPSEWGNVGQWTITNNEIADGDTVSFYAVDPAERDNLIANLRQFSLRLPSTVIQRGAYMNEGQKVALNISGTRDADETKSKVPSR